MSNSIADLLTAVAGFLLSIAGMPVACWPVGYLPSAFPLLSFTFVRSPLMMY